MDKFLLGLGVGMIGGVLFAPRSGSETRKLIADKASDGAEYVKDMAAQGMDQVKSFASDGVDYVKSRKGDLGSIAADVMDEGSAMLRRHSGAEEPQPV